MNAHQWLQEIRDVRLTLPGRDRARGREILRPQPDPDDGRLVIGQRTTDVVGALTPLGQDARIAALHADVRGVADRYVESGHPEVAIFEAFKAINNRVKAMTGLDRDGSALMGQAFQDSDPPILLADLSRETGRNIQAGYRFLFMGAVTGIRNPDAHEQFKPLDAEEALETLAFASLLMRRLDQAVTQPRDAT